MLSLSTDSQSPKQSPSLSPINSTNSKRMSRIRKASTRLRVRSIDNMDAIEDIQVFEIPEGNYNTLSTIVEKSEVNTVQSTNNSPKSNKLISKSSSFIIKSITDGKIEREREIFLRAALQLLQQDSRNEHIDHSNHSIDSKQSNINKNQHKQITTDVIRYGCLKKVSRTNTFSSIKSQFKSKYVELRYGKFTYEDYIHNHLPWNHHNHNRDELNNHNHKTIILSIDKCQCRPFQIRSTNGNCVFELTEYGGPRRLWMASSENERDLWVNNIRNAMIGCVDDTLGLFDDYQRQSPVTIEKPIDNCSIATNLSNHDDNNNNNISNNNNKSCEGPAAAFAIDIAKFVTLQDAVSDANSIQSFIHLVTRLYYRSVEIAVPVFYVKCHASSSNFAFSAQDILNRNTLLSVETSQIWKDLQRDNLVINGEHIRGESGTEAMIGAMMRHIMDKVDIIRCTDINGIQNNQQSPNRPKVYDRFDITEAQALACARDLLILCNRTQSGGDTYFCVDALLCNKQNNLCIVTPLSYEADPIEIYVDIVEEKTSKSMPSGITSNERLRARSMTEYMKSDLIDIVDINKKFTNESNIHHTSGHKPSLTLSNHNTIWDDQSTISELTTDTSLHNMISHSAPISLKTTPINGIKNFNENHSIDSKQLNDVIIHENIVDINKYNKNKNIFRALKSSFSPVNNTLPQFMNFKSNSKKESNDQIIADIHDSSSDNSQNSQSTSILNQSMNTNLCIRIEVQVSSRYRLCDSNPQDDNSTLGEVLGQFHQIFFIKSGCRGRPVVSDRVVTIIIDNPPTNPS